MEWSLDIGQIQKSKPEKDGIKITRYNLAAIDDTFLQSGKNADEIQVLINRITPNDAQLDMDEIYDQFCSAIRREVCDKVPCRTFFIANGVNNKRKRVKKAWWTFELTNLWNKVCAAEKQWLKGQANKPVLKSKFISLQKQFDREVQKTKRRFWYKQQLDLEELSDKPPEDFWKTIGKIGIAQKREGSRMPKDVRDSNGNILTEPKSIETRWMTYFKDLLNPDTISKEIFQFPQHTGNKELKFMDEINRPIFKKEVWDVINKARNKKSPGIDEISFEHYEMKHVSGF